MQNLIYFSVPNKNVGNQNGFVEACIWVPDIDGGQGRALLTLDNVENIVLYQVTMSDQFQN